MTSLDQKFLVNVPEALSVQSHRDDMYKPCFHYFFFVTDKRAIQLNVLLEYFTRVVSSTDKLISRLQKQSIDSASSLKMDVNCQR